MYLDDRDDDYIRLPGLYRQWDLPQVIGDHGDVQIEYVELADEATPLFAIWRRYAEVQP